MRNEYIVRISDFVKLEGLLNSLDEEYPDYHIYQILPNHYYSSSSAVVILERDGECV